MAEKHAQALKSAEEKLRQSELLMKYAKELYLYGSFARGETREDSDIDLLLVLDDAGREDRALKREIIYMKGCLGEDDLYAPEVDLKVVFGEEWKSSNQLYYVSILKEGKKLW